MGAAIFNGDGVKILKPKLKFKDSNADISATTDNLFIKDRNGTRQLKEENDLFFQEDFSDNQVADVYDSVSGVLSSLVYGDGGRALSWTGSALNGTCTLSDAHRMELDSPVRAKTKLRGALLAVEFNVYNLADDGDYTIVIQASVDGIVYRNVNSRTFDKISDKPKLARILFSTDRTDQYVRYQVVCNTATPSSAFIIHDHQLRFNPMPTAQFVEVNSVGLEGNDGRAIAATSESIPFDGTPVGNGWVSGANDSTPASGNYYVVQGDNAIVSIDGAVKLTALVANSVYLYRNGALIKRVQSYITTDIHKISFESSVGEFVAGDKLSFVLHTSATLSNATTHYLNINETATSSNVIVEGSTSEVDSFVRVHTGLGEGSVNTRIRRFSTIGDSAGTAITYADSTTLGASFTINENGLYTIAYSELNTSTLQFGVSRNSAELTTDITLIDVDDRLGMTTIGTPSATTSMSFTVPLVKGDVLRPHVRGTSFGDGNSHVQLTVTKQAIKPIYAVPAAGIEPTITKVLSANITSVGTISELTIPTVVGQEYEVSGRFRLILAANEEITIRVVDGVVDIDAVAQYETSTAIQNTLPFRRVFTATGTSLTFIMSRAVGTADISGNGSFDRNGSFVQLTERNRDGYPLVEVAKVVHSNAETWTGERWIDGRKIMVRSYEAHGSFTATVTFAGAGTFTGVDVVDVSTTVRLTSGTVFSDYKNGGNSAHSEVASNGSAYIYITGFTVADVYATFKYLE